MRLIRFLVPMGALLALLAFLPACDSGGGDEGTDSGGGADVAQGTDGEGTTDIAVTDTGGGGGGEDGGGMTTCQPACALCQVCSGAPDYQCVAKTCGAGETCDPVDGECKVPGVVCDPACNPNDCETCVDQGDGTGMCTSSCEGTDVCNAGTCGPPACECDPACGDCESCVQDGDGTCQCVSDCDAGECETCVGGACQGCPQDEFCDANDTCQPVPDDIGCVDPNEQGYCQTSIVDELVIAPAPNAATGEEGCCCDFTDDGVVDNQLAALVANLGGMAGFDLVTLNETVAESLAGGDFIILFEHVGLAAEGADTDYYDINFYLGADSDDPEDPTDNFSGSEDFYIMPESLDDNGDPLITFEGASVAGGMLNAGPSQFVIPVQLEDPPLDLTLTVDSAIVRATLAWDNGYSLNDGELCGFVTIQQIFNALNSFAEGSCGCLNLTGDLIEGGDGSWTCGDTDPACDPDDPETGSIQEICGTIAQYCSTAVLLLPSFLDVDLDGDETGDAISLGATFGATSANLIGVEGAMMK